ncbi:hypothetical protein EOI86_07935 [Hwanghaeella grinnelliae]|uniref:Uncharacterized protein n=1 Tax=Hwanghaeella grinnelliae TaxID=2500179 RepID=A0A3S2VT24_9PROT|nr:hypothetical protein [Hwanghaeella grinnelliae]RVU39169.1 hypothetical protein EOI86_07935 [Hwanghaeella grinnelliae]
MRSFIVLVSTALLLTGCATWSSTSVDKPDAPAKQQVSTTQQASTTAGAETTATKAPEDIIVTDEDITDRAYESLGDITATVNKTTIFNADPTPEMVEVELREKAAELGADAVVLVRYGNAGVSLFSWGSLEGKGRAVRFVE